MTRFNSMETKREILARFVVTNALLTIASICQIF